VSTSNRLKFAVDLPCCRDGYSYILSTQSATARQSRVADYTDVGSVDKLSSTTEQYTKDLQQDKRCDPAKSVDAGSSRIRPRRNKDDTENALGNCLEDFSSPTVPTLARGLEPAVVEKIPLIVRA